jgi:AcrR family transcriptional regulator
MAAARKSRPRTKPPAERRDELLNAAQRLFLKHGVGSTTIEQITSGAEVAKGTFYLYFSSKEDLLAALRDRFGQGLLTKIKAAIANKQKEDWKGKLATWAAAGVTGYLESIRLHDILFYNSHPPPTPEGLVKNTVIDHLVELLRAGTDAGAWTVDDPHFTAVFLFNGLHSVVGDACSREKRANRSRLTQKLQQLCLRAVGPPPR